MQKRNLADCFTNLCTISCFTKVHLNKLLPTGANFEIERVRLLFGRRRIKTGLVLLKLNTGTITSLCL